MTTAANPKAKEVDPVKHLMTLLSGNQPAAPRPENPLNRVVKTPFGEVVLMAKPGRKIQMRVRQIQEAAVMLARPLPIEIGGVKVVFDAVLDATGEVPKIISFKAIAGRASMIDKTNPELAEKVRTLIENVAKATIKAEPRWLIEADLVEIFRRRQVYDNQIKEVEAEIIRRMDKMDRLTQEKNEAEVELSAREEALRLELEALEPAPAMTP